MALQGWNQNMIASASEPPASTGDGAGTDDTVSTDQTVATPPEHATLDVDAEKVPVTMEESSALSRESEVPDEMWQAAGDAAAHDAASPNKAI